MKKKVAGKKAVRPGAGALVVDTATLAKYLGIKERTVRHYASSEGLPKLRQNRYDLVAVRAWELIRLKKAIAEQKRDDKRYTKAAADEKEEAALTRMLRRKKMEGLLIDRGEAERIRIMQILAVKGAMLMLPRRIVARIEAAGLEEVVQEEVSLVMGRFAGKEEIAEAEKKKNKSRI